MLRFVKGPLLGLAVAALALTLAACSKSSSSGSSTPSPRIYLGTTDSGDRIQFNVTDSSVSVADLTDTAVAFSASRQTLPSLFLEMTVTSATGGPAVGDHLVGLEFPGVAMIVKPEDVISTNPDSPIMAVAEGGVCPADGTYVYNVVTIPSGTWAVATDDAYSVVTVTVSGATITADVSSYLADNTAGTTVSGLPLTCAQGTLSDIYGTYITITPSGVLVSSNSGGGGGFVGMLSPDLAVDLTAVATGEYRGIAGGAASPTQPIGAQHVTGTAEAGDLNGFSFSDVLANPVSVDYSKVTKLVFGTQLVSPGLVNTGTTATDYTGGTSLTDGIAAVSSNTSLIFIAGQANGKYLLFGLDPTGPGNFLLFQQ